MTNYAVGHLAEERAAEYLEKKGYKILNLNWRTRFCEIDIIAKKRKKLHFIEVKYRKTGDQGNGLDYITPKKLDQMEFAARVWVAENDWDRDYYLGVVEVSGPTFQITNFLPDCS